MMNRKILLNPGPATTTQRVKNALVVEDICPREIEFGQVMHDICDGLLKIGKDKNEEYNVALFAASGTGAMEAAITSAVPQNGKVLIVTNGSYGLRMVEICKTYSIKYGTVCDFGDYPKISAIKSALDADHYTHLFMVHHETSTGMMNPLNEITTCCAAKGIKLILDAMSTFGAYPIDLSEYKIHYLISSSNKCIHGMAGLSFVIFHDECKQELSDNSRGFYFDVYRQWQNLKLKNQLRFTPPVQVCYAFKEAINETIEEGINRRWNRYQKNWQIIYDRMSHLGFTFYLPEHQQSKILLAINIDNSFDFESFHDYLYELNITVYPGVIPESNTFRVSVIGDLYEEDIQYVMENIEAYMND